MKTEKPWLVKFRKDFYRKKVLILGLGLLGRGVADAKFFAQLGAQVTVTDLKSKVQLKTSLSQLKGYPINFVLGGHSRKDIINADLIIRNAGVPLSSLWLALARKHSIPVYMDEALFLKYAPVHTIGITGTRGKSTTTSLIYEILKKAQFPVWLGGNIKGLATLPLLAKVNLGDWVVMELSSWQLQGFAAIKSSPHISVITNIYEDHLNYYSSLPEYLADKKIIFKYQKPADFLVLNNDSPVVRGLGKQAKAKVVFYSIKNIPKKVIQLIKIKGKHNLENCAAAIAVAKLLKINNKVIYQVIKNFRGLEQRLETIGIFGGVEYVNDSTSTTPRSSIFALQSFTKPIILLAGGSSKNLDMTAFAKEIAARVKKVIFLQGQETDKLISLVKKYHGRSKIAGKFTSLAKAFLAAQKQAAIGDIILLSPGCASFGMFVNEFDRGNQFKKLVLKYGKKRLG